MSALERGILLKDAPLDVVQTTLAPIRRNLEREGIPVDDAQWFPDEHPPRFVLSLLTSPTQEGWPGIVNGGVIAKLGDVIPGFAAVLTAAKVEKKVLARTLTVSFDRPIPVGIRVDVTATVDHIDQDSISCGFTIRRPDDGKSYAHGVVDLKLVDDIRGTHIRDMKDHVSASEVRSHVFSDAVDQFVEKFALDVHPRTREMVRDGGLRIQKTHDPSHDQNHYLHMLQDTEWILTMYPNLRDRIDWNTYLCALSFHDDAVSSLKPNPVNLFIAQNAETHIASRPATRYMRLHGFPKQDMKNVSDLIRLHPLDLTNSKRIAWEQAVDEELCLTGRLLYVVDSLDVFRPSRIDAMIAYIQRSLWKISPVMIKDRLLRYFTKNTQFSLDLGPAYSGIQEEADRRRAEAIAYITARATKRL